MLRLLKDLTDRAGKLNTKSVKLPANNVISGESKFAELKKQGYVSFYAFKTFDGVNYWICTLTQKAMDEYVPKSTSSIRPKPAMPAGTNYTAPLQQPRYSMIKCVCCGKDISSEARICPNCGQPTEYKKTTDANTAKGIWDFLWLIIGAVVLCAIIG